MEQVCARCARLGLGSRSSLSSVKLTNSVRTFSTSKSSYDEGSEQPPSSSPPPKGKPISGSPLRSALNGNATSSPAPRTTQSRPGGVLLRRQGGPPAQNTAGGGAGPRYGQRAASETGGNPGTSISPGARAGGRTFTPNRFSQRAGAPRSGPGQGQILVRSQGAQPRIQHQGQRRSPQGAQAQSQGPAAPNSGRTDRRVRRLAEKTASHTAEEDDPSSFHAQDLPTRVENYINTIVDPPANPTTELPHTPGKDLTASELRKDWPNTPLTNAGLVESVQQRIEWLAHRLPHGYQTPNQLAMHYARGNLTRFESVQERDEVLPIARTLAQRWADRDTEKAGGSGEVQPENMEFDSLVDREGERAGLADTWVKGTYPEVQDLKVPFLNQIVRNLNNNGSVTSGKTEQFMQTIQSVVASRQQAQKVAEK
ncbi:hypothetical protein H2200_005358 [Cladophialophora chaetospira]|uniref:Uncharacterized protein n=1 Tax=Cladophialophora chaetospira TaxID=386627 RepID=A0AA38XC13_9EURO|nr:hypothetical protein H2200_005358 [Cladophialophora chaetospira]